MWLSSSDKLQSSSGHYSSSQLFTSAISLIAFTWASSFISSSPNIHPSPDYLLCYQSQISSHWFLKTVPVVNLSLFFDPFSTCSKSPLVYVCFSFSGSDSVFTSGPSILWVWSDPASLFLSLGMCVLDLCFSLCSLWGVWGCSEEKWRNFWTPILGRGDRVEHSAHLY